MSTEQKDVENKNSDIRHIHLGEKSPQQAHILVVTKGWYWGLYAGLLVLTVALIVINRRQTKLSHKTSPAAGRPKQAKLQRASQSHRSIRESRKR